MGTRLFSSHSHTLVSASRVYWSTKTDALHRHSTEHWQQIYSSELLAMLPHGGVLLDIGCGTCHITTYLAAAFEKVYAVDFSESMLTTARQRIESLKIRNIHLLFGSAHTFPSEITTVDAILAHGVVQYFSTDDLIRFLLECRRVLKSNGIVCAAIVPDKARKGL